MPDSEFLIGPFSPIFRSRHQDLCEHLIVIQPSRIAVCCREQLLGPYRPFACLDSCPQGNQHGGNIGSIDSHAAAIKATDGFRLHIPQFQGGGILRVYASPLRGAFRDGDRVYLFEALAVEPQKLPHTPFLFDFHRSVFTPEKSIYGLSGSSPFRHGLNHGRGPACKIAACKYPRQSGLLRTFFNQERIATDHLLGFRDDIGKVRLLSDCNDDLIRLYCLSYVVPENRGKGPLFIKNRSTAD